MSYVSFTEKGIGEAKRKSVGMETLRERRIRA